MNFNNLKKIIKPNQILTCDGCGFSDGGDWDINNFRCDKKCPRLYLKDEIE